MTKYLKLKILTALLASTIAALASSTPIPASCATACQGFVSTPKNIFGKNNLVNLETTTNAFNKLYTDTSNAYQELNNFLSNNLSTTSRAYFLALESESNFLQEFFPAVQNCLNCAATYNANGN